MLSTCKLLDTLVGLTVDDRLGGLVVIDGPLVFPKFMNKGVSIIRESDFRMFLQSSPVNSGIGMQCLYCAFYMQVT